MRLKSLFFLFLFAIGCSSFPVLFVHGLDGSYKDCEKFAKFAEKSGVKVFGVDYNNDRESNKNLPSQVDELIKAIKKIKSTDPLFAAGFNIVAHGYGALIARAAIQTIAGHGVRTFLTIAGANSGVSSVSALPKSFYGDITQKEANEVMKNKKHQEVSGAANGWRDPDYFTYIKSNPFLPYLNNEVGANFNATYVQNFIKLNKFVMLGSPQDDVIKPWQTSLMEYEGPFKVPIPITCQPFWTLGMPFQPREIPIEIPWEIKVIAKLQQNMQEMAKMVATFSAASQLVGQTKALEAMNSRVRITEPCLNFPVPMVGPIPDSHILPCDPPFISYVHDAIVPLEIPFEKYYSNPFIQPPPVPIFIPPINHYRGFGLYELARERKVHRFMVPGVKYWDWLDNPAMFAVILAQLNG